MGLDKAGKFQCVGGWAFLLLAIGLFVFVPATILLGISAGDEGWESIKIAGVVCFAIGSSLTLLGVILCIYWCLNTKTNGEVKDPEADKTQQSNGSAPQATVPKPDTNGAALSESAAKYESQPENDDEEDPPSQQSTEDDRSQQQQLS